MKFFHLADLHFGKQLHNLTLTETDQRAWLEAFLRAVDEEQPDAVVMAGDIYDRKIPSPEAMQLFDRMITGLAKRNVPAFIIPGNHDAWVRLAHVQELLKSHRIYIAGNVQKELLHIVLPGSPDVTFWLLPYCFPKVIADEAVLNQASLTSYDEAVRALLDAQPVDKTACNVLIAHQNVMALGTATDHSDSETIIGGLGEIEVSAFDSFDYVALGHIHNAQKVGRETVRYAGCPMYYDFSEIDRKKGITRVIIEDKAHIRVDLLEIPLLHTLVQKTGSFTEVLEAGKNLPNKENVYVQCVLRDKHLPPRAMEQLRESYGMCLLHVKREPEGEMQTVCGEAAGRTAALSFEEQFQLFYRETQQEFLDGTQDRLLQLLLEQQTRGEQLFTDAKSVPVEDSEELLQRIFAEMGENA